MPSMERTLKDKTAIVGVGATPYYRRGGSDPQTEIELVGKATLAALTDAGLKISDIDGITSYANKNYTGELMETLGIPEVKFSAIPTGGGGASTASVGLASAAIVAGLAETVLVVYCMQQGVKRYGNTMMNKPSTPLNSFFASAGLIGPGHMVALMARRHMHLYGTTREHFAEVCISTRLNAVNNPRARFFEQPMTREDYFAAPILADPLCRYDFCLENDGAVALIVTTAERAKDLKQRPVYVMGSAHGAVREWGRAFQWMNMPDEQFASSGHASMAKHLFAQSGVTPADIDVAALYDNFSPFVVMQLEDYGFCPKGEGGRFVADGNIRFKGGSIPVNTSGGQLSEGYVVGMTIMREGIEQMRGTALNQVPDAEIALVTGGPAGVPVSGMILRR
jgi:acetyl-CoA acetyltransferase